MIVSGPQHVDTLAFRDVKQLPDLDDIEHGQLFSLSLSNDTTAMTHGLHRFPAKYIPQVPAWALDNFGDPGSVTLDPFMGSGTTLVEGMVRDVTSIGIDIDPLARFITRAKVTSASCERIQILGDEIAARWRSPALELRVPMPDIENFSHWFRPDQWAWLQSLHDTIVTIECSDDERAFLLTVFSSILRWVSNADDQSQKTYVSGTLPKDPPPVAEVYWRFFGRAIEGLAELGRRRHDNARATIPDDGDATRLGLDDASLDLAITSPPYLDSVDYQYNLMLEYFWLGPHLGVPDRASFNDLRRQPVGAKNPAHKSSMPDDLTDLIQVDALPRPRRAAAASYFSLMERHFSEVSRCLKPGGRYVMVVGNSQSRSNVLPLHEALIRQATTAGFYLERAFGYRIRRHYMKFPRNGRGGIILIDWVLVLRKQRSSKRHRPLPLPWVRLDPDSVAH